MLEKSAAGHGFIQIVMKNIAKILSDLTQTHQARRVLLQGNLDPF